MRRYILYNDDRAVARFFVDGGVVTDYVPLVAELLPMQIRSTNAEGFTLWVRERAIDLNTLVHRKMVSELYGTRDKLALALATHMFGISDTFTCFADGEHVPRSALYTPSEQSEVSRYILVSSDTSLRNLRTSTPNVSTDGSFPKTWEYENGEWWLYKLQSAAATRCEVEISRVLRDCGWDAAEYRYGGSRGDRVKTRCFLSAHEFFEPYDSFRYLFADKSDDDAVIGENIASLGDAFGAAWKRITLADAFFENTDRHMRNFGVIRSSITGELLRMAPNFDNNQAYLSNPGGRFGGNMLRLYMRGAGAATKGELKLLVERALKNEYLADAARNGEKYI